VYFGSADFKKKASGMHRYLHLLGEGKNEEGKRGLKAQGKKTPLLDVPGR